MSHNISEMVHAGHPQNQAVAASLANARRHPHGLALGGAPATPFYERMEAYGERDPFHGGGLLTSDVGGRTDRLPHSVAADSFVMPADVVSGLGQGNTLAGAKILDAATRSGPFGTGLTHIAHGNTMPHAPRPPAPISLHARGGNTGVSSVMLAGGEYLIPRDALVRIGNARRTAKLSQAKDDLSAGHEWARKLVDEVRKTQKKFLARAPKPKK